MIVPELLGHLGLCPLSPRVCPRHTATAEKTELEAPSWPGIICTLDFSSLPSPPGPLTVFGESYKHSVSLCRYTVYKSQGVLPQELKLNKIICYEVFHVDTLHGPSLHLVSKGLQEREAG